MEHLYTSPPCAYIASERAPDIHSTPELGTLSAGEGKTHSDFSLRGSFKTHRSYSKLCRNVKWHSAVGNNTVAPQNMEK